MAKGFRKAALFVRVVVTLPAQDVCSYHKIFWAQLKQYQHLFTGFLSDSFQDFSIYELNKILIFFLDTAKMKVKIYSEMLLAVSWCIPN